MGTVVKLLTCLVTLCLFCLGGCVQVPRYGEAFSEDLLAEVPEDRARLIVFKRRKDLEARYRSVQLEVKVDGSKVSDLVERTFFVLDIEPGEHEVSASVPLMKRPVSAPLLFGEKLLQLNFEAGEVYFLQYQVDAEPLRKDYSSLDPAAEYQGFRDVTFAAVGRGLALKRIKDCWAFEGLVPEP